ncbi:DUF2076 domain-containing protein [Microvirga brassicacearum]|uniref:DUF2076 domain-containing protein n=1 Tax=Microvirga brassicacearum TaxID=2580413 RepID=A0A5N3P3I0_9HYPH|nr:DUF2076 domain-containing protein [Microvirga brassicacearum]KAB0264274.1 DUF2076 domain-containing protein [Microvirga brassicacearum]
MNDQEREVIADIFRRLEQVADQPRDPEAERFISEKLRQQPYAPYAMAQAIFVQEQALTNLQSDVETLRAEVEEARRQPQAGGGILSSLFGGGQRPQAEPYRQNAPGMTRQAAPWGGPSVSQRQPGYSEPGEPRGSGASGPWGGGMGQPRGGGGFLQGALSTAAGVAGGMMVANALTSAFGGKPGGTDAAAGEKAGFADTAAADATTDDASITNSLYENPSEEQPNDFDDFGGEGGDEGDWV